MLRHAAAAAVLCLACCTAPQASDAVGSVPSPAPVDGEGALEVGAWRTLAPGLEVAVFQAHDSSTFGDSKIRVVRADPARFEVALFSGGLEDGKSRTAKEWSERHGLVATINLGMFHPDGRTTGYMRVGDSTVNPDLSGDKAVLVAGPREEGLPGVRILDRECDDAAEADRYVYAVQSIRMLSCSGNNVWSDQPRMWSHAILGMDRSGRLLLIHARSPWSTHDFIEQVRSLPLEVDRLMYGEGGPEAQLYVNAGRFEAEWYGSYETGFYEHDTNDRAWPVPNILGIRAPWNNDR